MANSGRKDQVLFELNTSLNRGPITRVNFRRTKGENRMNSIMKFETEAR
jgi:hypothetical protein